MGTQTEPGTPTDPNDPAGLLSGVDLQSLINGTGGRLKEGQYIGLPDSVLPGGVPDPARGPIPDQVGGSTYNSQVPAAGRDQPFTPYKQGDEYKLADLPPETITQIQMAMRTAGLLSKGASIVPGTVDNTTLGAWRELLGVANRQGMNPFAVLQQAAVNAQQLRKATTATQTTTSVNLTDPITAHAIARNAIQSATGRAPTDQEYEQFLSSLNGVEQANPSVSTTTSTTDPTGNTTSTTSTTSGGAPNPNAYAEEFAHKGKLGQEANTYMAATDYYKAALATLGAGGGNGAGL